MTRIENTPAAPPAAKAETQHAAAPASGDTAPPRAVLELVKVSKTYGTEPAVHALTDVDLVLDRGEWLAITGPSGAGKSTPKSAPASAASASVLSSSRSACCRTEPCWKT
jgi:ABC-type glutathione transport system ATPase component